MGMRGDSSEHHTAAGWCGIASGIGLVVEAAFWMASGWTPLTFADPSAAVAFLTTGGAQLRWAVLAGFINLALLVVFNIGLSKRLADRAPALASATLWFGMIGITMHLLVPLSHWYGVPMFLDAAARDKEAAQAAWTAFNIVGHEAAGGGGKLFMGLSMMTAGWAMIAQRALSPWLGWCGLLTGAATVLTIFSPDTALSQLAYALFMPSLLMSIVFRIWAGTSLALQGKSPRPASHRLSSQ